MIADWFAIYLVGQGLRPRADGGRLLGAVPRRRPRQLLRRRLLERAHPARVAGGPRAPARDRGRAARRPRPRPGGLRVELPAPRSPASRSRPSPTRRCPRWPSRCPPTSTRAARSATVAGHVGHGRRPRHDRLDLPDRRRRRPLLLHPDPASWRASCPLAGRGCSCSLLVRNTRRVGPGLREGDLMRAPRRPRVVVLSGPSALPLVLRRAAASGGSSRALRLDAESRRPARHAGACARSCADADALVTTWDSPRFGEELLGARAAAAARRALRRRGEGRASRGRSSRGSRSRTRPGRWRPTSPSWR